MDVEFYIWHVPSNNPYLPFQKDCEKLPQRRVEKFCFEMRTTMVITDYGRPIEQKYDPPDSFLRCRHPPSRELHYEPNPLWVMSMLSAAVEIRRRVGKTQPVDSVLHRSWYRQHVGSKPSQTIGLMERKSSSHFIKQSIGHWRSIAITPPNSKHPSDQRPITRWLQNTTTSSR